MGTSQAWTSFQNCFVYEIRLPVETRWSPEQALRLMHGILGAFPSCIFRIAATSEYIAFDLIDWGNSYNEQQVILTVQSVYPEAKVIITDFGVWEHPYPTYRSVTTYTIVGNPMLTYESPLNFPTDFHGHEPLIALTQVMDTLLPGERLEWTLINNGVHPLAKDVVGALFTIAGRFVTIKGVEGLEPKARRLIEEKFNSPHYDIVVCLQADSPVKDRVKALENLAEPILTHGFARSSPLARLARHKPLGGQDLYTITSLEEDLDTTPLGLYNTWLGGKTENLSMPFTALIPQELAALWHLPHNQMTASHIEWIEPEIGELPDILLDKHEGIQIGTGSRDNQSFPVYMTDHDRTTHMNVVGKTGVGKTTFLHNLIHQDIARGEGVAVIDPTGNLVHALLQSSIPTQRECDVVVLDLNTDAFPPPFNPLRTTKGYIGTGKVIDAIEHMYQGSADYVRLSKYLRAALEILQADPSATMRDLSRVFRDVTYRNSLLATLDSDFVYEVWEDYDDCSDGVQQQIREPIVNRISPFWANPILYPMFCHPDTLNIQEFIKARKIVLISLHADVDRIPEQERNLIGSLLISQLQMAGMKDTQSPYRIYIDEVQKFVTTSLDVMLAEARQFGLSLTIANQFLGQLQGNTLKAVMGTIGASIVFQVSPDDAREFAPYMDGRFTLENLANLHQHHAAVKMRYLGNSVPAFGITTPPPLPITSDGEEREKRIRQLSIEQYTPKSKADVLEWLRKRYPRKGGTTASQPPSDPKTPPDDSGYYEPK